MIVSIIVNHEKNFKINYCKIYQIVLFLLVVKNFKKHVLYERVY